MVYRDDVQIVEGGYTKRYAATPGVLVRVWPVVQPAAPSQQSALLAAA